LVLIHSSVPPACNLETRGQTSFK